VPLAVKSMKQTFRPRKVLIYGTSGVGKTTWASKWPKPVMIRTEDGANGLDCDAFDLATDITQFTEHLGQLETEQHEYETLIIDSLDWLERIFWAHVCKEGGKETIKDFGYGDGYVAAAALWSRLTNRLSGLIDKGMNIVLIAHASKETVQDPEHGAYDRFAPKLDKRANGIITEWCDEVLYATFPMVTKTDPTDKSKKNARQLAVGIDGRVIYTTYKPHRFAKNRLGLPEEMPLDFESYWQFVPKAHPKPAC